MGNRAIIVTDVDPSTGIYLHWNGGPESVLAFLAVAKKLGCRGVEDHTYFLARLTQIIGNYFGGTLSVGVGRTDHMDDSDNGIYTVGNDFAIVQRQKPGPSSYAELDTTEQAKHDAIVVECLEKNAAAFASR